MTPSDQPDLARDELPDLTTRSAERCNGIDDDGDGRIDEGCAQRFATQVSSFVMSADGNVIALERPARTLSLIDANDGVELASFTNRMLLDVSSTDWLGYDWDTKLHARFDYAGNPLASVSSPFFLRMGLAPTGWFWGDGLATSELHFVSRADGIDRRIGAGRLYVVDRGLACVGHASDPTLKNWQIGLVSPDGTTMPLLQSSSPIWVIAADPSAVIAVRGALGGSSSLVHIDPATTTETVLSTYGASATLGLAAMSERFIAFVDEPGKRLALMDRKTGSVHTVTDHPFAVEAPSLGGSRLGWLDGRNGGGDLYTVDLSDFDDGDFSPLMEWRP